MVSTKPIKSGEQIVSFSQPTHPLYKDLTVRTSGIRMVIFQTPNCSVDMGMLTCCPYLLGVQGTLEMSSKSRPT